MVAVVVAAVGVWGEARAREWGGAEDKGADEAAAVEWAKGAGKVAGWVLSAAIVDVLNRPGTARHAAVMASGGGMLNKQGKF